MLVRFSRVGKSIVSRLAWVGLGLSGLSCSDAPACEPPIPPNVTYRVRVTAPPSTGTNACRVIDLSKSATPNQFELTTDQATPSPSRPDCSRTPLKSPPVQHDVTITKCVPYEAEMLGLSCEIEYEPMCPGRMNFFFRPIAGQRVDWAAKTINNVEFVMSDRASGCLTGVQNCDDVYKAELERIVN